MNIESLAYSVTTAIIGMGVVFVALGILSILMYFLRVIVEGNWMNKKHASSEQDSNGKHTALATPAEEMPSLPKEVVLAGAALYLHYEARNREYSANMWQGQ